MTTGHVYCKCGRIIVFDNHDPIIRDQTQRHVKQQLEILTTAGS